MAWFIDGGEDTARDPPSEGERFVLRTRRFQRVDADGAARRPASSRE